MLLMVSRWPDQSLESILRLVFFHRHWLVQFHGCSSLVVMRLNLLDLFLELLGQRSQVSSLLVPFLESACWASGVLFRPVQCLPWPVAYLVSSQPNSCLDLRSESLLCHPLVELLLVPNSKTPKVLARQSRVLVRVVRRHLKPALFLCLELQLVNLLLLVTHPFLGLHPSNLRVLLGVPSRALPLKSSQPPAMWVQPQDHWSVRLRWPV
jgi:hypothetical protein